MVSHFPGRGSSSLPAIQQRYVCKIILQIRSQMQLVCDETRVFALEKMESSGRVSEDFTISTRRGGRAARMGRLPR